MPLLIRWLCNLPPNLDDAQLVRLGQARKRWNRSRAVKAPLPRLGGEYAGREALFVTPLRSVSKSVPVPEGLRTKHLRRLGIPHPIEPAPALLKADHLRLGKHPQKLLVLVAPLL